MKASRSPFAGKPVKPVKAGAAAAPQRQPLNPVIPTADEAAVLDQMDDVQQIDKSPRPRSQAGDRIPFGSVRSRYPELPAREGFHRRWFNDVLDRLSRAQMAGYSHVVDDQGRNYQIPAGFYNGQAISQFAMELPEEFRNEDVEALQDRLDARDQLIYRGALNEKPDDKRYVPTATPIKVDVRTGSGRG